MSKAIFHRDYTVSFFSTVEQTRRERVPVANLVRGGCPERDSFDAREWNRICRAAGCNANDDGRAA